MKNLQPRPSLTRVYYHILQKMLKSSLELLISISCVPVGLLVDKVEGWICHFNILPRCQIDLGWQYCWKDFFLLSCHTSACLVCMFYSQIHIITDYLLWMTQFTLIDGITLVLHRGIHLQLNLTVTVTSPLRTSDCLFILFLFSPGSVFLLFFCLFSVELSFYSFPFWPWYCLFILFLIGHGTVFSLFFCITHHILLYFYFFSFLAMKLVFSSVFEAWYCLYHFLAIIYLFIIYFDAMLLSFSSFSF